MPPWRRQLKLLGKIKQSHSTDPHGGVKGIFSVGLFFFFGHGLTVPAIVFVGQGVKPAYGIFSCLLYFAILSCGRALLLRRGSLWQNPFSSAAMEAGAGPEFVNIKLFQMSDYLLSAPITTQARWTRSKFVNNSCWLGQAIAKVKSCLPYSSVEPH